VGDDRLTQDELAMVLRRAAELDVTPAGSAEDDRLPIAAVEAAAAEVGLPATVVRQAVAELRAGLLRDEAAAVRVGPTAVVEAGVVPFEPERAMAEIGRWLGAQTFHCHRGRDGVEVWRVREDWVAGMQRAFDWSASVRLKGVREVVVRAVEVEGGTLLRLEATLAGAAAAAPAIGAGSGAVVASGAVTPLAVLATAADPVTVAVGIGAAGLGALGGWLAGRSVRRSRRDRIADELAAELDRLATGRTADHTALERLKQRVTRPARSGGRWV
jgi:hypothetical protein